MKAQDDLDVAQAKAELLSYAEKMVPWFVESPMPRRLLRSRKDFDPVICCLGRNLWW